MRWEWFPRGLDQVAISGFDKHFVDPIETVVIPSAQLRSATPMHSGPPTRGLNSNSERIWSGSIPSEFRVCGGNALHRIQSDCVPCWRAGRHGPLCRFTDGHEYQSQPSARGPVSAHPERSWASKRRIGAVDSLTTCTEGESSRWGPWFSDSYEESSLTSAKQELGGLSLGFNAKNLLNPVAREHRGREPGPDGERSGIFSQTRHVLLKRGRNRTSRKTEFKPCRFWKSC